MASMDELRAALGDGPDPQRRLQQRARFLIYAHRPTRMWKELAVGALAAGLGSVLVFSFWSPKPEGLALVTAGDTTVFNEGSEVHLTPGGRMQVARVGGHETVIVLEAGELHASITSGLKNVWRFQAGSHEVIVRGTKLSVAWSPTTEELGVGVTEGSVEVRLGDGTVQRVTAGQSLKFPPETAEDAAPTPRIVVAEPAKITKSTKVASARPAPSPAPSAPALAPGKELRSLTPEWKRQAEASHYGKAVTLVEEQGVEAATLDATPDDLLLLADAARLVRKTDLGIAVLTSLREKFANAPAASEAAFRLGSLEFDTQRYAEAGRWFDLYVREAPQGAFIAEASGRRLDAWQRSGDARAIDAATDYLEKYAKGAYAPLAKKVLGGDDRQ
jgi:hypothetical protein